MLTPKAQRWVTLAHAAYRVWLDAFQIQEAWYARWVAARARGWGSVEFERYRLAYQRQARACKVLDYCYRRLLRC